MALQLSSHFVAFIDLLGFSEMVRADCESSQGPKFLRLLYDAHLRATSIFGRDLDAGLTQFSDSVVFSRPFDLSALPDFISSIAAWQRSLLMDGLLCRGGIAFGKHFAKERFLFSKALIDAYHLESNKAKYPRIIVSHDLMELAASKVNLSELRVVKEEDGAAFVDYLYTDAQEDVERLAKVVGEIIDNTPSGYASVEEKMRWLARYADHKLGTKLSGPRFAVM